MKITGSEAVMKCLLAEGVTTIFGYPGGAIMPVYDALYGCQDKIKHVLVRHKQAASQTKGLCSGYHSHGSGNAPVKRVIKKPTKFPTRNPTSKPVRVAAPVVKSQQNNTSQFTCNCSKSCNQMKSCREAYYQLNACGCSIRDGDNDGIPCEAIC